MFTGLIEEVGQVKHRRGAELCIHASTVLNGLHMDDSISVNGVCLTAVDSGPTTVTFKVSPETYEKSTLGYLQPGEPVNLERAMSAEGRFGGHFVQGHVDGVGSVMSVEPQGEFSMWRFLVPPEIARYMVPKGSIAVDGISLTVVDPDAQSFGVAIIPTTLEKTNLRRKQPGDPVNIEADMMGKHIYHYLAQWQPGGLTRETLEKHGFA
jgi:riboflavin synthase